MIKNSKFISLLLFGLTAAIAFSYSSYFQSQTSSFVLITFLYNETDDARVAEYIKCLEKNLSHPLIKRIHVIYDNTKDTNDTSAILTYLKSKPVTLTYHKGRPTFQYCFNLVNAVYPNFVIILSNADIYFNETLNKLTSFNLQGKFLALTRWNCLPDGSLKLYYRNEIHEHPWSQDAWIFKTPFTAIGNANITLGVPHCDGKIAYLAYKANLNVLNPCKSIQCCHLHASNVRNYKTEKPPLNVMRPVRWSRLEDYKSN